MESLVAHIPMDRRQALAGDETLPGHVTGAALFADVSGFTALAGALAGEQGQKRGAEQLLGYINPVYEALITELHRYRGSVISFAGDAITCWLDDTPRAVACALAMQRTMRQFTTVHTPAGTPVSLGIKVAVAAGRARRLLVGNPAIKYIDVLAGATLERMTASERQAERGEVVVSQEVIDEIGQGRLTVGEWRREAGTGRRFAVVDGLAEPPVPASWPPIPRNALTVATLERWLLPAVCDRLRAGQGFLGDLRPVSPLFLKFGGIDYDGDPAADEKLDAYICWVQGIVDQYGGALMQLTIGDKGSYVYACFGAPLAHEDDPHRAMAASLALRDLPSALDYIGKAHVGMTRGEVWTGVCGAAARHCYGVMGNEVNLAARLMARAQPGQILVSQRVAEIAADRYRFRSLGAIRLKGRTEPLPVAAVIGRERRAVSIQAKQSDGRMVGRQAELNQLATALDDMLAGQGRVLFIEGKAGIGKSRLVTAFLDLAREQGPAILLGAGRSIEQHTPYRAWRDLVGSLLGLDDSVDRQERVRQQVAHLAPDQQRRLPLLNDILHLGLPDNDLTTFLPPDLRRQSLTLMVQDMLRTLAGERPLVLILEDAQWLDALSWELALQVARGLQSSGHTLLLLLVKRPLAEDAPGARYVAPLQSLPGTQTIALSALDSDEIAALVTARLGLDTDGLPAGLDDLVRTHAEGNPLFAEELVFALHDQGVIRLEPHPGSSPEQPGNRCIVEGDLSQAGETLSDTLQGLILTRIDRLPPDRQLTLKMAAVIGRSFAYATLHHTINEYTPVLDAALEAHLAALVQQDLIAPGVPPPNLAYVFKHVVTQEVAYQTLLFDQRRQIHRIVAAWYEATFGTAGQLAPYLPLLVYHYHHAEETDEERRYARLAGEQSARQGDHENAIRYLSRALDLTAAGDRAARFELLRAREQVYDLAGAREPQARDLDALARTASALADPCKQAEVALRQANYAEATSNCPAAVAAARRAIDLVRPEAGETPLAGELLALGHIAWSEALRFQGDYPAAQAHLEQATSHLRRLGADRALAMALRKLGIVFRSQGQFASAMDYYEQALVISRALGDRQGEAAVLNNLGAAAIKQREYTQALARLLPALTLYRELGDRRKEAGVLNNLGLAAQGQGDGDGSRVYREQALVIYREIGDRQGEAMALGNLGRVAGSGGDHDQARAHRQQALAIHREIGDRPGEAGALNNLGLVAVAQDDADLAHACFEQALAIYREIDSRQGEADALSNLGALAERQDDRDRAREHFQQALAIYREIGSRQAEAALLENLETLAHKSAGGGRS